MWTAFLTDQFAATPPSHIGVACAAGGGGGGLLGAVVLRTAAADDAAASGWAAAARAGGLASAARLALRDTLLPETVRPGEVLIEYLAVAPAARRRGVAGALLAWAESTAGGAGVGTAGASLGLWVTASNAPALSLYARAGFVETERTEGALTRAACAVFLGEAGWVRMERPVAAVATTISKKGTTPSSLLLPPSLPSSPRLASYRPV